VAGVLRVAFLAVAYAVILLPPRAFPVATRRTISLLALLLVMAVHLLLAAVTRRSPSLRNGQRVTAGCVHARIGQLIPMLLVT
jgi:hypothetical protein